MASLLLTQRLGLLWLDPAMGAMIEDLEEDERRLSGLMRHVLRADKAQDPSAVIFATLEKIGGLVGEMRREAGVAPKAERHWEPEAWGPAIEYKDPPTTFAGVDLLEVENRTRDLIGALDALMRSVLGAREDPPLLLAIDLDKIKRFVADRKSVV